VLAHEIRRHRTYARAQFGWRAQVRRWWWIIVRRYECEICNHCGRPVGEANGSYWLATDGLWARVEGKVTGVSCMRCFAEHAVEAGTHVWWLAVEGHSPSGERLRPYPHSVGDLGRA
jgi:hypothetical protein